MSRWVLAVAVIALTNFVSPASAAPKPSASNILQINKARIDRALGEMVSDGRAAGVSALIFKNGREVYFGTAGHADREARAPVRRDTMFQVFSMTKPVTGVALMQLWEDKRFGLDDPLAMHLPEYAQTKVFKGTDAGGQPILRAPERPILIRDILRHTAGFGYGPGESFPEKQFATVDPLNLGHDLTEFSRRLATVPLMFEPGTRWHYSAAVDVQARLVEKLSGMVFEDYVRTRVLQPLGMKDTAWTQPQERFARLATSYAKGADGKLTRMPEAERRMFNFSDRKLTMGGAGLASTADEYMRFARMLLNNGTFNGVRILKPSTVKLMATDHLDPRVTERAWLPGKGNGGFGLDFFVRTGQAKNPEENRGAIGEFFWDGAWSTFFIVDPANDLAAVFLVQTAPFDGTMHRDFRKAVYGADYLGPKGD